jgi:hypothetical protein
MSHLELTREDRPFHKSYFKCYICGERFRMGDDIFFISVVEVLDKDKEAICKKCSENEAYRIRNAEKNMACPT